MSARDNDAPPPRSGLAFWIAAIFSVGTVAYWIVWYGGGRALLATANTPEYFVFENAFPVADAWLAAACGIAALGIRMRREWAVLWTLLAGSACIYLGCMDVLFDLENGIYLAPSGDWGGVAVEAIINAATLAGGAYLIVFGWRKRRSFA